MILVAPNMNDIIPPYILPIGIITDIIGSTFGARKGSNLISNTEIKVIMYLSIFFIYYASQTPETHAASFAPVVLSVFSYSDNFEKSIFPIAFDLFSYSAFVIS